MPNLEDREGEVSRLRLDLVALITLFKIDTLA